MKYKIIVDKQSRITPTEEKKEYIIDIEELRYKGDICDTLVINAEKSYVDRKLNLSEYGVLSELETPKIEELNDVNIQLFEGDNYIYLVDMTGNRFYAEYVIKNDLTDTFATRVEMNTKITQTAESIMSEVTRKVDDVELGTKIEQNWEHVKIAWNQISEFIQLMILNNNASFAILDANKNVMMALDKEGQHFYKNDGKTIFGEMGVQEVNDQNYISFSIPTEYDKAISDGMAWGVTTKSDGKFHPILYIKDFKMPPKNSGGATGELQLDGCNLILGAENGHIIAGGIEIIPETIGGITFAKQNDGSSLMTILKGNSVTNDSIYILDNISLFKNQAGSNSFRIGSDENNSCLLSDDGSIIATNSIFCDGDITSKNYVYGYEGIESNGFVSGKAFIDKSREEVKKNIQKYNKNAINEIMNTDIYEFNYKTEEDNRKKHIGFIIGDKYKYSKKITEIDEQSKEVGANIYSMVSVAYKAIQEQQEEIEKIKEKDKIITNLIEKIEKLEEEVKNGKNQL